MGCCLKNKDRNSDKRIELGRVGEYGARTVTFDLSEFSKYEGGEFKLLHQRSVDFDPYIVTNAVVSGNQMVWSIGTADTAYEGVGYAEIQLQNGDVLLAKSSPYMTYVSSTLEVSDSPESRSFLSDRFGSPVIVRPDQRTYPSSCCNKKSSNPEESRIELGHVGEYGARDVKFNLSSFNQFGGGVYALIHKRATDFAPYAVQHYDVENNELVWHIDETDTACEGIGYAEIQLVNEGVLLAKSEAFMTFTESSLGSTEIPASYTQATIDTVAAYAASAKTYMEAAESYRDSAAESASYSTHPPAISETNTWLVWDGTQYIDSSLPTKGKDAYTYAVEGGYTESEETFYEDLGALHTDAASAAQSAIDASGYAINASSSAENSEAWAVGQRDGTDVESGDPTYHNNSKYYAELADDAKDDAETSADNAADSAQDSEAWAVGKRNGSDVSSSDVTYQNNSKYYSGVAASIADSMEEHNEDAEAWAVGKRNGTNVSSDDPAYHNNAKYYADAASSDASSASLSAFNSNDYAQTSEAWAVGTRGGQDISISDPAYHNYSKYYAEQAAEEASYSNHPPIIGDNDNWFVWNGTAYEDSGKSSKGEGMEALAGGAAGNILIKSSSTDYDFAWTAPATSAVSGSSLPITSGAVYTIIGNIETLLAAI